MLRKNIKYILFVSLCFVFMIGIFLNSNSKNVYKKSKFNKYATAQIEGFEKSLFGSTGWALIDLPLKVSASSNSDTVATVSEGQAFMILGESGSYWEIMYGDNHGYIEHDYCMINLPDVVPSIKYNITNASSSMYKSSGYDITSQSIVGDNSKPEYNITGYKLYSAGKIQNNKIDREEYIVPSLYSTAKKIAKAEVLALQNNKRLMIYDSYRPVSVSKKVSAAFGALADSNDTVAGGISGWDRTWFIATITPGVNMSAHNVAAAIDVSLWDNETNGEVTDMPTEMHELSKSAARCTNSSCGQLSSEMSNSASAMLLSNIMINSNVGMGTLASEWWHYQDNEGINRLKAKTNTTGRDFQVTEIVSTFGYAGNLTTVGDVNGDGFVDFYDAELIYQLYDYLNDNSCDTCGSLIQYSDMNGNNQVDLDDVFLAMNSEDDFLTSSFTLGDDYVYLGSHDAFNNSIISLKNYEGISRDIKNDKFIIKYNDKIIKEYDIVSIYLPGVDEDYLDNDYILNSDIGSIGCVNCNVVSDLNNNKVYIKYGDVILKTYDIIDFSYEGHDLSLPYIFSSNGIISIQSDILTKRIACTNCVVSFDDINNKLVIKKNLNDSSNIREYDIVYYSSNDYDLNGNSINIVDSSVQSFLSKVSCTNCVFEVYNGFNKITSGNIPNGSNVVVNETVSGDLTQLKSFSVNLSVTSVKLNKSSLSLNVGSSERLTATVSPSDANNKRVTWSSSNTSVATVDNEGNVRAVSAGNAVITVTTEDGSYSDTCDVSVIGATKYTVTFVDGSETYTDSYEEGEKILFKNLTKEGYIFKGWKYNDHNYGLNDVLNMPNHDIELTAIWEPVELQIGNTDYHLIGNVLTGIDLGTDVSFINLKLPSIYSYSVYDGDAVKTQGSKVGTGNKIRIYLDGQLVTEYIVSIKGDLNGNGKVTAKDLVNLRQYIKYVLNGDEVSLCYIKAGDLNNNGKITSTDLVFLRSYIKELLNAY